MTKSNDVGHLSIYIPDAPAPDTRVKCPCGKIVVVLGEGNSVFCFAKCSCGRLLHIMSGVLFEVYLPEPKRQTKVAGRIIHFLHEAFYPHATHWFGYLVISFLMTLFLIIFSPLWR